MSNTQTGRNHTVTIQGFGYVNRIREAASPDGRKFLACDVSLLQGIGDNLNNVRFNCVVHGQADDILRNHFAGPTGKVVQHENTTVLAGMKLGGISARNFVYSKGEKKGQTGISLRSNLLSFTWLKIGDTVIDLEDKSEHSECAEGLKKPDQPIQDDQEPKFDFSSLPSTSDRMDQINGYDVFHNRPMKSGRRWPAFAGRLGNEYRSKGSIRLRPSHFQFEAEKAFLREQGFVYDCFRNLWVRPTDREEPVESFTNKIPFDLRHLDFRNTDDSPINLEGSNEQTIRIYLQTQFLGETEFRYDADKDVWFWAVFLLDDPRGEHEIRDPRAIVDETRRWAEAHPSPSVESVALPA